MSHPSPISSSTHPLRVMGAHECADAAGLLGRAFGDNPGYRAILPWLDDEARHVAVTHVKRGFVDAALRYQHVNGIDFDGRLGGVAIWSSPGEYPLGLAATLIQARRCARTGPRGVMNLLRMDAVMKKRHPREAHYYLFVLGTEPTLQGRGLGGAMLEQLNAIGDAARLPWYLETDKPSSVKLYRRHGYDVVEEFTVPALGDLRMWTMLRRAR